MENLKYKWSQETYKKTSNFLTAEVNKGDPDCIEIAQLKSCLLKSKTLFPSLSLFEVF